MSEIEETAKATQEVAKTANNALNKAEKFGGFITKYFGTTMEQSIGIFNDKLIYWRWDNQVNLISKANKKMEKLSINHPTKQIPLKLGLPLIEAASLEDDSRLQDLWANLLVNSSTGFSLERSYISVLEQLSPLEAQILIKIYNQIKSNVEDIGSIDITNYPNIKVSRKPSEYYTGDESIEEEDKFETDKTEYLNETHIDTAEFNLALSNLIRLNCLLRVITFGGGENFKKVHPTIFGAKLYESVKEPTK